MNEEEFFSEDDVKYEEQEKKYRQLNKDFFEKESIGVARGLTLMIDLMAKILMAKCVPGEEETLLNTVINKLKELAYFHKDQIK